MIACAGIGADWASSSSAGGAPPSAAGLDSAGQAWNWAWLAGQVSPEHGAIDPIALLDDESEGVQFCLQLPHIP